MPTRGKSSYRLCDFGCKRERERERERERDRGSFTRMSLIFDFELAVIGGQDGGRERGREKERR